MLDFSVTFIITIINIVILTFILRALLFKPVTKFMAERAKRVRDSIEHAENDKAKAYEMLGEYENKLKNAEAEAQEIIKTAREKARTYAESIVEDGKLEAEKIIAEGRKQIEIEGKTAFAKFKVEAAALVIAASAKLSAREFSSDDNRRYVNMMLEELQSGSAAKKGNM